MTQGAESSTLSNLSNTIVIEYSNVAQMYNGGNGKYEIDIYCTEAEFVTLYDKALLAKHMQIVGGGFDLMFSDPQPLAIDMAANVLRLQAVLDSQ